MSRRLLWLLFGLSLLVNLFFLGGYFLAQQERRGPDELAVVAEELELTLEEREALAALKRSLSARMEAYRQETGEARAERYREMLEVIAAEQYDREALQTLIAARREAQASFWLEAGEELNEFLRRLPPEKRQRFIEHAAEDRRFLGRLLFGWGRRD